MSPPLEANFQRRAVKVFEPVEIPQAQRELILEAARVAPSSFNMQPYRFYWVESPSMRKRAAQLCNGPEPGKTASALVVAVADIGSWRSTTQSHLERVRQRATKSTSLACENLMIAAEALGLNTCPMEGFDGRRLSKFLGLSSRYLRS
jgi:nitroreductase